VSFIIYILSFNGFPLLIELLLIINSYSWVKMKTLDSSFISTNPTSS